MRDKAPVLVKAQVNSKHYKSWNIVITDRFQVVVIRYIFFANETKNAINKEYEMARSMCILFPCSFLQCKGMFGF